MGFKDTLLPIGDVAERYNRCVQTIKNWRKDEELGFPQPVRRRRRLYWSQKELISWESQYADRMRAIAA